MRTKLFKRVAKVAVAIAVLVVAVFIFVSATYDFSALKAQAEKLATEQAGQPVKIGGDMSFGFSGFRPAAKFSQIIVGNDKKPTAVIDQAAIALPLSNIYSYLKNGSTSQIGIDLSGLVYEGKEIGDISGIVNTTDNGLSIKPLTVDLPYGGRIDGDVDYQGNKLAVTAKAKSVDYALIMPGASGGDLGGTLTLSGTGATVDEVLSGLDGKVALGGGGGKLSGDALRLWGSDLLSTILTGKKSHTDVTCLVLNGNIKNGVLVPSQAVLDTENVLVRAKGSIDLGRQRLKLLVTPAPKDPALISLATPVNVTGAWDNPSVAPDGRAVFEKVGGLVLGAVAPPAALLAFGSTGDRSSPCAEAAKE